MKANPFILSMNILTGCTLMKMFPNPRSSCFFIISTDHHSIDIHIFIIWKMWIMQGCSSKFSDKNLNKQLTNTILKTLTTYYFHEKISKQVWLSNLFYCVYFLENFKHKNENVQHEITIFWFHFLFSLSMEDHLDHDYEHQSNS